MYTFIIKWNENDIADLARCLSSIEKQPNIETEIFIIGRKKESETLLDELSKNTAFSYVVCPEINVFVLNALFSDIHGEYIQFLDEKDQLTIDWCFCAAEKKQADFILGYQVYEGENLFEYNLSAAKLFDENTTKEELLKVYQNHGGEDRYLKEINNKLIRRELLLRILSESKQVSLNEDFFFTYLNLKCLAGAEHVFCMHNTCFIYGIKKEVHIYGKPWKEVIENFAQFIHEVKNLYLPQENKEAGEWEKDWYRELINTLYIYHPSELVQIIKKVQETAGHYFNPLRTTSYFEKLTTELGYGFSYYLKIKEWIASDNCNYVGFDVFDTLVERPFWEPTDLFFLLNKKFNELVGKRTVIDFSLIRKNAEQGCRAYYSALRPSNEDVSFDEIYDYISKEYGIPKEISEKLKAYEIALEQKYCLSRKIGKELYKWAQYCKKTIYILSDMYLPQKVIEKILRKNGYDGWKKLYVSNEVGVSKYSGKLFDYFLKEQHITRASEVCFIGDNYQVDFCNTKERGIKAFHVPRAVEVFQGENGAIYAGEAFKKCYCPNGSMIDSGSALKFLGIRCMLAVTANKFFGNPFVSFQTSSDFNADIRFIGYFCAGTFLFSEAQWLLQESERRKLRTIHFVARDGYYVKLAYDKLRKVYKKSAQSNYLYLSRKAVAPLYLENPEGIYEIFLPPHILVQTPLKIIQFLRAVSKDDIDTEQILKQNHIVPFKKFDSLNEFYLFAKVFRNEIYDAKKAADYKKMLYRYFSEIIGKEDVIFDVGYSGRMETALTKLLGYPVSSYYFHEHEPWALTRKREIGFGIDSFYSFKPCSAFVLREQIFTPAQPSCIGFKQNGDTVEPEFGTYQASYKEEFIMTKLQEWALCFIDDMIGIFDEDLPQLEYNRFDACIPFEYFLHYAKKFDQTVFLVVDFEDDFGTNDVLSICDYWEKEQKTYHLNNTEPPQTAEKSNEIPPYDLELLKQQLREEIFREETIFTDGLFMAFYEKMNKWFPMDSKRRETLKKAGRLFIKEKGEK